MRIVAQRNTISYAMLIHISLDGIEFIHCTKISATNTEHMK